MPAIDLTRAVAPWLRRDVTFRQMQEMAGAVTSLYRSRGYLVASAYLGAQTISGNALTITVIEGRIGAVRLRSNHTRVPDEQILQTLTRNLCQPAGDCTNSGPIRDKWIERAALLVSEIPGVDAKYELAPGGELGTTDILLDASAEKRFSATVGADNNGFAFTGRKRGSLALSAANLLRRGDLLAFSATYTGKGFFAFSADASAPIGRRGARIGAAGGHLSYSLRGQFAVLGVTGVSDTVGLYATYPVLRSLTGSMDARLDVLGKRIRNTIEVANLRSREEAGEVIFSVSGSQIDHLLQTGSTQYRFAYTQGELRLRDQASRMQDAATARTNGSFGKFNYLVRREELVIPAWTLFAQINGQYALNNLDPSEKIPLGGSQAVRAYDTGAAAADSATLLTIESRIRLPSKLTGRWEFVVAPFYDHAWARFNKRTWPGYVGPNRGQMAGTGTYVSIADPGRYSLRATYARKVRTSRDVVPNRSRQIWVEAAAAF